MQSRKLYYISSEEIEMEEKRPTKGKVIGTIDVTPKWVALYPVYAEWIDSGTKEQKQLVKDELLKLCKVADAVNAKSGGGK